MPWLDDTRTSYDTVAASYADLLRDSLAGEPFQRGILALFAEVVRAQGDTTVADVGCGPGRLTGYLRGIGLDAFGIDLSPGMIEVARRDHPGVRFEVGSMTALDLPGDSLSGVLAWFSLIHVPDDEVPVALAEFHRVLRPGGAVLIGFHAGEGSRHKTEGYGGHPMNVNVHHRTVEDMTTFLARSGFAIEATTVLSSPESTHGAILHARRD
jgi:ubiquinone/menaquinone biosynthesis C-methylase UbiE